MVPVKTQVVQSERMHQMSLRPNGRIQNVRIDEPTRTRIRAFLQGAVYDRIKTQPDFLFAAYDLMGGVNYDWSATPLSALYDRHAHKGRSKAVRAAGIDLGRILKSVLHDDSRDFEMTHKQGKIGMVRAYRWIRVGTQQPVNCS
jgi:hypothetical protein